jgi:hypothetical protein
VRLEAERAKDYGDFRECHAAIALAWTGYLANRTSVGTGFLQPHDVAGLMAMLKLVRAAFKPDKEDSWLDAEVYISMARRMAVELKKRAEETNAPDTPDPSSIG